MQVRPNVSVSKGRLQLSLDMSLLVNHLTWETRGGRSQDDELVQKYPFIQSKKDRSLFFIHLLFVHYEIFINAFSCGKGQAGI